MDSIMKKLANKEDLTTEEAEIIMQKIISGESKDNYISEFLTTLKTKGETIDEIYGFAKIMRKNAIQIHPKSDMLVDTCGTGGDNSNTFNISTAAAVVAAGAGIPIAKHGNRSVSSNCGSVDVLEELGAKMLRPEMVKECIDKIGIGFMFAPFFHPAMKNVASVRKKLGFRTVFNILGPLTNPAGAKAQVLGVYDPALIETMATILGMLGTRHALVVHSDGMDEVGLGRTKISELKNNQIETYDFDADDLGIKKAEIPRICTKKESAEIIRRVLNGEQGIGREIVALNAAAAIYANGKAKSIANGLEHAYKSMDSGAANRKLQKLIEFTVEQG
ncbi:MAG: anthranilate phosphoribosyltransferase [Candidatus Micrarchaeota archaeon]|nr:anthranilate phosphoribosyltransferase [Candidatus Micrarchaeota archaeon]MBU1886397.1 anthranilate phosphoribosyltransferase [Candidatus Micrarchaeota archaeon]